MYEMDKLEERVILVGVQLRDDDDTESSLYELEELAFTAGAATVAKVIQNRASIHAGTYIGKGKLDDSLLLYMMRRVLFVMMNFLLLSTTIWSRN